MTNTKLTFDTYIRNGAETGSDVVRILGRATRFGDFYDLEVSYEHGTWMIDITSCQSGQLYSVDTGLDQTDYRLGQVHIFISKNIERMLNAVDGRRDERVIICFYDSERNATNFSLMLKGRLSRGDKDVEILVEINWTQDVCNVYSMCEEYWMPFDDCPAFKAEAFGTREVIRWMGENADKFFEQTN